MTFVNLAWRDFIGATTCALHTVQWKLLRIAAVVCPNFRRFAFNSPKRMQWKRSFWVWLPVHCWPPLGQQEVARCECTAPPDCASLSADAVKASKMSRQAKRHNRIKGSAFSSAEMVWIYSVVLTHTVPVDGSTLKVWIQEVTQRVAQTSPLPSCFPVFSVWASSTQRAKSWAVCSEWSWDKFLILMTILLSNYYLILDKYYLGSYYLTASFSHVRAQKLKYFVPFSHLSIIK